MRLRVLASIAAVGTACALLGTPAQAEEKPNNCVLDLPEATMTCYDTFTEAIAAATEGVVTDAPNDVHEAEQHGKLQEYIKEPPQPEFGDPRLPYILSIEYEDDDYGDSKLIARGERQCSNPIGDVDYYLPRMPAGWNDQIGSFSAWYWISDAEHSLCYVQHFEHDDFQGGWIGPSETARNMGGMDDETSSIRWT